MKKVEGKRSPRWALWQKMTIPCENGLVYLVRRRVVQTPWFAVYVHDINEPDNDRGPHNHPWNFWSVILKGSYMEKYYEDPTNLGHWRLNIWDRFSVHKMNKNAAHRIVQVEPGLKTLIITGKRVQNWGFFVPDGSKSKFVPWQEWENLCSRCKKVEADDEYVLEGKPVCATCWWVR